MILNTLAIIISIQNPALECVTDQPVLIEPRSRSIISDQCGVKCQIRTPAIYNPATRRLTVGRCDSDLLFKDGFEDKR